MEPATWEDVVTMKDKFSDFHLDNKVVQRPASNNRVLRVYVRKKGEKTEHKIEWRGKLVRQLHRRLF